MTHTHTRALAALTAAWIGSTAFAQTTPAPEMGRVLSSIPVLAQVAVPRQVQNCRTETTYETRTQGYNVTYEYAGKQYTVQMPQDPGAWVPLRVSPVLPSQQPPGSGYSSPVSTAPVFLGPTVITQETTYLQPPVTYVRPSGYVSAPNTQFWLNVSSDRRQPYTTHHHSHGRVNGTYGYANPGRDWDDDRRWR